MTLKLVVRQRNSISQCFLDKAFDLLRQFSEGDDDVPGEGTFFIDSVGLKPRPSPRNVEEYAAYCKNREELLVRTATCYFSLQNQLACSRETAL